MEELNIQGLLDYFKSNCFKKGEQVILGHFGTVQTLLSLIFEAPVNIRLIDQEEKENIITRQVELICGSTVVASATSHIPESRNKPEVLFDISSGKLGLGQIIVTHNLPNRRILVDVGRDSAAFWRTYTIEGPGIFLEIHEYFPREPFEAVGWLEKEG